jgi:hypothetical protein
MSKELCPDCANRNGCAAARANDGKLKICYQFKSAQPLTDKQRVERAKADIEAIITKLESDCDMKLDHVLVFWSYEKNKWAVEISLK